MQVDLFGLACEGDKDGGTPRDRDGQEGPVQELDVDTYGNLNRRAVVGDEIQHDHMPAFATVRDQVNRERAERGQKPLTPAQERKLADSLTTMAMSDDTHSDSRTYKGRNKRSVREADGEDLRAAANKDLATARENLIAAGHDPEDVDAAIARHQEMNENNGVYEKPIPSDLWGGDDDDD